VGRKAWIVVDAQAGDFARPCGDDTNSAIECRSLGEKDKKRGSVADQLPIRRVMSLI